MRTAIAPASGRPTKTQAPPATSSGHSPSRYHCRPCRPAAATASAPTSGSALGPGWPAGSRRGAPAGAARRWMRPAAPPGAGPSVSRQTTPLVAPRRRPRQHAPQRRGLVPPVAAEREHVPDGRLQLDHDGLLLPQHADRIEVGAVRRDALGPGLRVGGPQLRERAFEARFGGGAHVPARAGIPRHDLKRDRLAGQRAEHAPR